MATRRGERCAKALSVLPAGAAQWVNLDARAIRETKDDRAELNNGVGTSIVELARAAILCGQGERGESDEQHHLTRFAGFKALGELLELQAGERACLAYMERNGSYKGRVIEYLRSSVDAREVEIRDLQANDRWFDEKRAVERA